MTMHQAERVRFFTLYRRFRHLQVHISDISVPVLIFDLCLASRNSEEFV
jgi:hypothetical protein